MHNNNFVGILALIIAILVGIGTFLIYDRTNELKTEIEILKISSNPKEQNSETPKEDSTSTSTTKDENTSILDSSITKISTALLLEVPSDPSLRPTTSLSLTIPEISRNADGTMTLQLKIFTDKATGYTAFNPKDTFSIIDLTGDDLQVDQTTGQFGSMPARSSTSGTVIFHTDPNKSSLILKIKMGEDMKFYELDFKNRTYKETIIG